MVRAFGRREGGGGVADGVPHHGPPTARRNHPVGLVIITSTTMHFLQGECVQLWQESEIRFARDAGRSHHCVSSRILMMRRFVCAGFALFLPSVAMAQASPSGAAPRMVTNVETAADLAAVCNPTASGVPRLEAIAYCQGFITSAGQYHALLHPAGGAIQPLYCMPTPPPTIAQSGIAFAAWLNAHPAHSAEPALDGLLRWQQEAFPCPAPAPAARTRRSTR
jgi:hypothetical protein